LQLSSIPLQTSVVGVRRTTSAGHGALEPVHASGGSQAAIEAEARHTVPAATKLSAGQLLLAPVQFSARSHTPADARHTVLDDA
jgi:hypothetical protein